MIETCDLQYLASDHVVPPPPRLHRTRPDQTRRTPSRRYLGITFLWRLLASHSPQPLKSGRSQNNRPYYYDLHTKSTCFVWLRPFVQQCRQGKERPWHYSSRPSDRAGRSLGQQQGAFQRRPFAHPLTQKLKSTASNPRRRAALKPERVPLPPPFLTSARLTLNSCTANMKTCSIIPSIHPHLIS